MGILSHVFVSDVNPDESICQCGRPDTESSVDKRD